MKNIKKWICIVTTLLACSGPAQADGDWAPKTDGKYKTRNPAMYHSVMVAKDLIDEGSSGIRSKFDEADEILRQVLIKDRSFTPAHVEMGRKLLFQADMENAGVRMAELAFDQALELEPENDYALAMKAAAIGDAGDPAKEMRMLLELQKKGSSFPYLTTYQSVAARMMEDYPTAVGKGRECLQEGHEEVRVAIKCREALVKALELTGNVFPTHPDKGMVQKQHERVAEMGSIYQQLQKLAPNSPYTWGNQAFFELKYRGDYEKGIEYATKALRLKDYLHARNTLARAYYIKWNALRGKEQSAAADALAKAMLLVPPTSENLESISDFGYWWYSASQSLEETLPWAKNREDVKERVRRRAERGAL